MTKRPVTCARAILVKGMQPEYLRKRIAVFPLLNAGLTPYTIALKQHKCGWHLVGFPKPFPRELWLHLACEFCGIVETLAGDLMATPAREKGYDVIAVQHVSDATRSYYLTAIESTEDEDFCGRREDGRAVQLGDDRSIKVGKVSERFPLGTSAYLRSRGIPDELLPTPEGFVFRPTLELAVNLELD